MDSRKQTLLKDAITQYIDSAEPVGSKVLAENSAVKMSSATIRNELNELEKEGYLTQTHTSSGRIPTDKGYRFYVDQIQTESGLTTVQKTKLIHELTQVGQHIDQALGQVSELLHSLIDYTTIVLTPDIYQETLKVAHLLLVDIDKVLVVLLNSLGVNSEFVLTLTEKYDQEDLNKAANLINQKLAGKPMTRLTQSEIMQMNKELPHLNGFLESLGSAIKTMANHHQQSQRMVTRGMSKMLKLPEFRNIEMTQKVLEALEENKVMATILSEYMARPECKVLIGQEHKVEALQECSFVVAPCMVNEDTVGLVGVLGPKRMAYSTIVPLVDQVTTMVSQYLSKKTVYEGEV